MSLFKFQQPYPIEKRKSKFFHVKNTITILVYKHQKKRTEINIKHTQTFIYCWWEYKIFHPPLGDIFGYICQIHKSIYPSTHNPKSGDYLTICLYIYQWYMHKFIYCNNVNEFLWTDGSFSMVFEKVSYQYVHIGQSTSIIISPQIYKNQVFFFFWSYTWMAAAA